jgi:hypothetical protein
MVELYYLVVGYVFYFELFLKKTNEIFKIIPVVFISLLLLLSYKIVSKINHKKEVAANIKPFPILLIRI